MEKPKKVRWAALILAAGKGKRMQSDLPKVLHEVSGKPMVQWIIDALKDSNIEHIGLVLGAKPELFQSLLNQYPNLSACRQIEQKGTADAVAAVAGNFLQGVSVPPYSQGELISGKQVEAENVAVCVADIPGISKKTLSDFFSGFERSGAALGLIGMHHPNPYGYGRLLLNDKGELERIIEERDTQPQEKKIGLCNTGFVVGKAKILFELLAEVKPNNEQKEYYLTDCFALARARGAKVFVFETRNYEEFSGINNPEQLKALNDWFRENKH